MIHEAQVKKYWVTKGKTDPRTIAMVEWEAVGGPPLYAMSATALLNETHNGHVRGWQMDAALCDYP
jgi:hypothetical protein